MRIKNVVQATACLILGSGALLSATAQRQSSSRLDSAEISNVSTVPSRVVERIDDARLVTLAGNTYPKARPQV